MFIDVLAMWYASGGNQFDQRGFFAHAWLNVASAGVKCCRGRCRVCDVGADECQQ